MGKKPEKGSGVKSAGGTMATFNMRQIPEKVRDGFSAACRLKGTNMSEAVKKFMAQVADGDTALLERVMK